MFPIIGAALVGAILMGRTKPKTKTLRKVMLGPHSGITYQVEEFPEAGFLSVRAPDGACATLARKLPSEDGPALSYRSGYGNPHTLERIKSDFLLNASHSPSTAHNTGAPHGQKTTPR